MFGVLLSDISVLVFFFWKMEGNLIGKGFYEFEFQALDISDNYFEVVHGTCFRDTLRVFA